jgi:hypothetical protein
LISTLEAHIALDKLSGCEERLRSILVSAQKGEYTRHAFWESVQCRDEDGGMVDPPSALLTLLIPHFRRLNHSHFRGLFQVVQQPLRIGCTGTDNRRIFSFSNAPFRPHNTSGQFYRLLRDRFELIPTLIARIHATRILRVLSTLMVLLHATRVFQIQF